MTPAADGASYPTTPSGGCPQRGLQAAYFTSQSMFDRETEQIFRRDWLCIGRIDDLASQDGFATVTVEGCNILLLTDKGQVRAFHNVCRHRGAVLTTDRQGKLIGNCITCAYHAWSYTVRGEFKRAPNLSPDQLGSPGQWDLTPIACTQWNGFVFVNLSGSDDILPAWSQEFSGRLTNWRVAELKTMARLEYVVAANWKLLFQNYSECYHCPSVHPLLSRMTSFRSASNDSISGPVLGGPMQLDDAAETMSTDGRFVASPLPNLTDEQRRQVCFYTVFPTMFFSNHPDYLLIHRIQRLAVDQTQVSCEFLFDPAHSETLNPQRAVEFWDTTNRQDWYVCELVQQGVQSPGYRPGPYSRFESVLPVFDQYYLDRMRS